MNLKQSSLALGALRILAAARHMHAHVLAFDQHRSRQRAREETSLLAAEPTWTYLLNRSGHLNRVDSHSSRAKFNRNFGRT